MQQLHQGVRGPEVGHLQRLLNQANLENGLPDPDLSIDCVFGPRTRARLEQWQRANGITTLGTTDARTWHDLGQFTEIDHAVTLFPQPTGESCWSAAATMIFGDRSVGQGQAVLTGPASRTGVNQGTIPHFIAADAPNLQTFLTGAGLRYQAPRQWTIAELVGMLRRGPVWAAGNWQTATQAGGHAVTITAVWADQAMGNGGTTFRVHDPWPPRVGAIYGARYDTVGFQALVRTGTSFNVGMLALGTR